MSASIKIGGKTYVGNSISIVNGVVSIDGVTQSGDPLSGVVQIEVTGDLANLRSDASVNVNGNVKGNVDAGGSVNCGPVGGSIDAGGSVNCGSVGGSIDAGGSVRHG